MSRHALCAGILVFLSLSNSPHAELLPQRGPLDGRIRSALYDPRQVYRLEAFVGYQIELIFADDERFAGNGGGDLEGIAFGAYENHVLVKPRAQHVDTNLVVYTNRRAYRFDYVVHDHTPDPTVDEVMYAVQFVYPQDDQEAAAVKERTGSVERSLTGASAARAHNLNYWFCGSPAVKPVRAFDDGVQTHLLFNARSDLPAVFVLNDDDTESLLNFTVESGEMVIHRLARRFIVRRGALTGCIVNRGYGGGGARLDSGTIAPEVVRERRPGAAGSP
jgi:type IV secretion system protein VirB9